MKFQKKMFEEIILASKSLVRKKILEENGIKCTVEPSNIDEDLIKESLLKENSTPKLISKSLALISHFERLYGAGFWEVFQRLSLLSKT